jgi:hypothetical protein
MQAPVISRELSKELGEHRGRWVAVFQERIVAVADSAGEAKEAALKSGVTDPMIFRVPEHYIGLATFR